MSDNQNARVIFADSRQISSLLSEKSVDLILTGPPYWNEVVYSSDDAQLSRLDNYSQFLDEISKVWNGCSEVLKDGSILAIWVHDLIRKVNGNYQYIPLHSDIVKTFPANMALKNVYIWDRYLNKNRGDIKDSKFGTRVQYILIFQKEGLGHNSAKIKESLESLYWQPVWHKKTLPKLLGSSWLSRVSFNFLKSLDLSSLSLGSKLKNMGLLVDDYRFKDYMTECPADISNLLVNLFSSPGDIVLDPFIGSGTTLRSALNLGRQCVGIEINKNSQSAIEKKLSGKVTFG